MKRRTWKRTLLMVLLLLTGGAIINVAVAWGCSFLNINADGNPAVTTTRFYGPFAGTMTGKWSVHSSSRTGVARYWATRYSESDFGKLDRTFRHWPSDSPPPNWVEARACAQFSKGEDSRETLIDLRGWPLLAAYSQADMKKSVVTCGIPFSSKPQIGFEWAITNFAFPIAPLWPGFAINTIFYAAILWLLFAAPGFVRRRIRARRGLCTACGYPIGTNPVCTKCGKPVTQRSK